MTLGSALTAGMPDHADAVNTDDLETGLNLLGQDIAQAVTSYLGLSVVLTAFDQQITLATSMGDTSLARTSMLMPLAKASQHDGVEHRGRVSALILYAETPGAFIDLAADLSWLTGLELDSYALDQHLPKPNPDTDEDLGAIPAINRAIGILIERGHAPDDAHRELTALAATAEVDVPTAARRLFDESSKPSPPVSGARR